MTSAEASAPRRAAGEPEARRAHRGLDALEPLILTLVPLVVAAYAFWPITENYFFADDFVHFYSVRNGSLVDYVLSPAGGHLLVTVSAVFVVLSHLFGTHPEPFFAVVLATHVFNVYLLSRAIDAFTGSRRLACLGATLWGISPANEGALGWYSVYGHVLVATTILALLAWLGRLAHDGPATWRTALGWLLLLFCASTSFGVGLGMAMAFPIAAYLVLPPGGDRGRLTAVTAAFAVAVPFLYLGLHRLYPSPYSAGATFGSVLAPVVDFWGPTLRLLAHILTSGAASLLAGAAFDWDGYPSPSAYALAGLVAAGFGAALLVGEPALRRRLVAATALVVAGYAFIAMGRGAKFATGTTVPLRALRYHYAAPAVLALVICLMLAAAQRFNPLRASAAAMNALLAVAIVVPFALHLAYAPPIDHHDRARRQTAAALAAINEHIAAAAPGQPVYIPNGEFGGVGPVLRQVPDVFPGTAGVFVVFFPDNVVDGKRVYFIEDRAHVRRSGTRTADLFVLSYDVPQQGEQGEQAR